MSHVLVQWALPDGQVSGWEAVEHDVWHDSEIQGGSPGSEQVKLQYKQAGDLNWEDLE